MFSGNRRFRSDVITAIAEREGLTRKQASRRETWVTSCAGTVTVNVGRWSNKSWMLHC